MPRDTTLLASASAFLVGASNIQAVPQNNERRYVSLYNGGPQTVYLGLGATAVASFGWPVASGGVFTDEYFAGQINAVTASGTGFLIYQDRG